MRQQKREYITPRWTAKDLARRIASKKPEDAQLIEEWLESTPRQEAITVLTQVANEKPYPRSIITQIVRVFGCFTVLFLGPFAICISAIAGNILIFLGYLLFLAGLSAIAEKERRKQVHLPAKAALLMARLNDERAIPWLAENWLTAAKIGEKRDDIAEEIVRLCSLFSEQMPQPHLTLRLHTFLAKSFPLKPLPYEPDITETESDMYLALLRYLARSNFEPDRSVLQQIALTRTEQPNRRLVVDTAQMLLDPPQGS
jgi:hypothetical protein